MDGPMLHSIWTVVLLVVFVAILVWVYGVRSKAYFDEAARLPLDDDEAEARLDAEARTPSAAQAQPHTERTEQ